jgi:hypothetical protein
MTGSPLDPLRALFGEQLQELTGAVVAGEVPLTVDVINALIARKLATSSAPVAAAVIETHPEEAFTVHLRLKGPWPQLRIEGQIDRQPEFPGRPVVGIRWTLRGLGPLASLAAPLITQFKELPPGVTLDRERIWIDLAALLQSHGYAEVLPLLTAARIMTRERRFVLQFEVRR